MNTIPKICPNGSVTTSPGRRPLHLALFLALGLWSVSATAEPVARFTLTDVIGHAWTNELVSYRVAQLPAGRVKPDQVRIVDADGKTYPVQLAEVLTHLDGSMNACTVWIRVDLPARGTRALALEAGEPATPGAPARAVRDEAALVLDNGLVAVRLPPGTPLTGPTALKNLPSPIQAVRVGSGPWMGKGWLGGDVAVTGMTVEVTAAGPLFAEAVVTYVGAEARAYSVRVRLPIGKALAQVEESFNLPAPQDGPETAFLKDPSNGGLIPTMNFAFTEGFKPDALRFKVRHTQTESNRVIRAAAQHEEFVARIPTDAVPRRVFSIMAHMSWWSDLGHYLGVFREADGGSGPLLGVMRLTPSRWFNPTGLQFWNDPQKGFYLSAPLGITHRRSWEVDGVHDTEIDTEIHSGVFDPALPLDFGRRAWAFYGGPQAQFNTTNHALVASPVNRLMIQVGEFPLNKVKDWTLAWDGTADRHPRLRNRPEDAAAVVARINGRNPGDFFGEPNLRDGALGYFLTGKSESGVALASNLIADAQSGVDSLLDGGGSTGLGTHFFPMSARLRHMVISADYALACPALTREQVDRLQALSAFLTYVLCDRDYNPVGTGYHLGNPNMPLALESAVGMAGCLMPSHPESGRWCARAVTKLALLFERFTDPATGAWEECPHYMVDASFYQAFEAFNALRNSGYEDLFRLPAVKAALRYAMGIMSPPDPRFGIRILATQGNTSLEGCTLFGWAAAAYRHIDPPLSAECQWMWDADGRQTVYSGSFEVIRPDLPARPPSLATAWYHGFGAVLRNGFPASNETWMAYRQGQRMSHYENGDPGSWHLYAKGVPLSLDFGSQYGPIMERPWLHNRISVDHKLDPMLLSRHDLDELIALAGADFVTGEAVIEKLIPYSETPYEPMNLAPNMPAPGAETIPPVTWRRSILFVKDRDLSGPNYFVVRDSFEGATRPTDWSCWSLAREVRFEGPIARFTGQLGMDLDVVMLAPAKAEYVRNRSPIPPPPTVAKLSYGPGVAGWPKEYQEPAEAHAPVMSHNFSYLGAFWKRVNGTNVFEERQLCARVNAPAGEGYFALLYPRRHEGEAIPGYAAWAGEHGAQVTFTNGHHYILAARDEADVKANGVTARAATAIVRDVGGTVELNLVRGTKLAYGSLAIEGAGPVSVRRAGVGLEGDLNGPSRTVVIEAPARLLKGRKLQIDDRAPVLIERDRILLSVSAGPHSFRVE